jgi:hypothetical protein
MALCAVLVYICLSLSFIIFGRGRCAQRHVYIELPLDIYLCCCARLLLGENDLRVVVSLLFCLPESDPIREMTFSNVYRWRTSNNI